MIRLPCALAHALAALLGVLACALPAWAQDEAPGPPAGIPPSETIAMGRDGLARMTVPVRINGAGPFAFMVDTGAQRTVLTHAVARKLALAPAGQAVLVSVAGTDTVDIVHVRELMLGSRRFADLETPLVDDAGLEAEGILGLDSLQGQRVTIDFAANRLTIDDAAAEPAAPTGNPAIGDFAIVVNARHRSGQLIMTEAVIDGVRTSVMIDTGSDTSIGNPALQRALRRAPGHGHGSEEARLVGVTGQAIAAQTGQARSLRIGRIAIANLTLAFADSGAFARLRLAHRPALLLGMHDLSAFRAVAIDFSRHKVLFGIATDGKAPAAP
jgi:predicted aspartyl protease